MKLNCPKLRALCTEYNRKGLGAIRGSKGNNWRKWYWGSIQKYNSTRTQKKCLIYNENIYSQSIINHSWYLKIQQSFTSESPMIISHSSKDHKSDHFQIIVYNFYIKIKDHFIAFPQVGHLLPKLVMNFPKHR